MEQKAIIVFAVSGRFTSDGKHKLRHSLAGEQVTGYPLAIASQDGFDVLDGKFFTREEVAAYAEKHSGYKSILRGGY